MKDARKELQKRKNFGVEAVKIKPASAYNHTVNDIDTDLSGTLTSIGIEDNQGVDYTLYATKMLTFLPKPMLVNVGVRNSSAAHNGLLGFTDEREFLFEV